MDSTKRNPKDRDLNDSQELIHLIVERATCQEERAAFALCMNTNQNKIAKCWPLLERLRVCNASLHSVPPN